MLKYQVFHMRNETSFDECRETVSPRSVPNITKDELEERCKAIWSSKEWNDKTDWIEIYPIREYLQ